MRDFLTYGGTDAHGQRGNLCPQPWRKKERGKVSHFGSTRERFKGEWPLCPSSPSSPLALRATYPGGCPLHSPFLSIFRRDCSTSSVQSPRCPCSPLLQGRSLCNGSGGCQFGEPKYLVPERPRRSYSRTTATNRSTRVCTSIDGFNIVKSVILAGTPRINSLPYRGACHGQRRGTRPSHDGQGKYR